ncbi:MAG: 4Fe-4S binding protein [Desulfobacterales bacterium]
MDLSKCTSCGECTKVCPIEVPDEQDRGLSFRKAIYKKYPRPFRARVCHQQTRYHPCKATCPAHVSIQGYIALINEGKYFEALKLFKQDHPFPGICGRVCHHPCEGVCTRGDYDESLAIRELHRFLADWEQGQEPPIRRKSRKNGMKRWQWSAPGPQAWLRPIS